MTHRVSDVKKRQVKWPSVWGRIVAVGFFVILAAQGPIGAAFQNWESVPVAPPKIPSVQSPAPPENAIPSQSTIVRDDRYPLPSRVVSNPRDEIPLIPANTRSATPFGSENGTRAATDDPQPAGSATRPPPTASPRASGYDDRMSPVDWGQDPQTTAPPKYQDRAWAPDPPAYDSGPSLYEQSQVKQQSPSIGEILNKGSYFGSVDLLLFQPHFQGSTAVTQTTGASVVGRPIDYDYGLSPRITAGFESQEGPGIQARYWNFNEQSETGWMTSDGVTTGESGAYLLGPERWSRLNANNPGEQLITMGDLKVQSLDLEFFKDLKFPRARLNGTLGLTYATIDHRLRSRLLDAADLPMGELVAESEFEGWGPTIGMNYRRPVGHTKLELLGGIQAAMLFGNRAQAVTNSSTLDFSRFYADELVTRLSSHLGAQYVVRMSERRSVFGRIELESQHWIGGGTANNPIGDFGLFGWTFGVGVNR